MRLRSLRTLPVQNTLDSQIPLCEASNASRGTVHSVNLHGWESWNPDLGKLIGKLKCIIPYAIVNKRLFSVGHKIVNLAPQVSSGTGQRAGQSIIDSKIALW